MSHFVVVAIKQRQEASLRAGCPFDAPESQIIPSAFDVPQIPKEFLSGMIESKTTDLSDV